MHDEAPFLAEFVAHYLSLGFGRIYYINTSPDHGYVRCALSAEALAHVTILDLPSTTHDWQEAVLNEGIRSVREDWLLSVDVDEFLSLGHRTIQDYLASLPAYVRCIRFPWLMCVSTRYTQSSVFDICQDHVSPSKLYKSMAHTASVTSCGVHTLHTKDQLSPFAPSAYSGGAFILHFSCRGFFDLINRVIGRNYENDKSSPAEAARLAAFFRKPDLPASDYPFRFHLYRLELTFPRHPLDPATIGSLGRVGSDCALLRSLFLSKLDTIDIRLPDDSTEALDDHLEGRFGIRRRLLESLPNGRYASMHLDNDVSYVNITRAYLKTLTPTPAQ